LSVPINKIDEFVNENKNPKIDYSNPSVMHLIGIYIRAQDNKGVPMIPLYHVDHPKQDFYTYISRLNQKQAYAMVYCEKKYDGTHIQICKTGVFSHSGRILDHSMFLGLLQWASGYHNDSLFNLVNLGYVFDCELFGSHYTPVGFHKKHSKEWDLRIFEVGNIDKWLSPVEKVSLLVRFDLTSDFVGGEQLYAGLPTNELIKSINDFSSRDDWFEGTVVKVIFVPELANGLRLDDYVKTGSIVIAKVKVKEQSIRPEKQHKETSSPLDTETENTIVSEITNELRKIKADKGKEFIEDVKNTGTILRSAVNGVEVAHPDLVSKVKESSPRFFSKRVIEILNHVRSE
jgi:hypothetical protein